MLNQDGGIQFGNWFFHTDLWIKASPALRSIIVTIFQKASYCDKIIWDNTPLKRGQLPCSLRNLAKDCNVRPSTLRDYLNVLTFTRFITRTTTHRTTIITVNYYNELREFFPKSPLNLPYVSPHKVCQSGLTSHAEGVPIGTRINNNNEKQQDIITSNKENIIKDEIPSLMVLGYDTPEKLTQYLTGIRNLSADLVDEIIKTVFKEEKEYAEVQ